MFKSLTLLVTLTLSLVVLSAPIPKAQVEPDLSLQNPQGDDEIAMKSDGNGVLTPYQRSVEEDLEERQVEPDLSLQNPQGDDEIATKSDSGTITPYERRALEELDLQERDCADNLEERQVEPDLSLQNPQGDDEIATKSDSGTITPYGRRAVEERQVEPDLSLQNPQGDDEIATKSDSGTITPYERRALEELDLDERDCFDHLEERQVEPDLSLQNPQGDDNIAMKSDSNGVMTPA